MVGAILREEGHSSGLMLIGLGKLDIVAGSQFFSQRGSSFQY